MKHVIRRSLLKFHRLDNCGFITLQPLHFAQLKRHLMRKKSIITGIRYYVEVSFPLGYMTNVMILTSMLSTFHSFPATYHPSFIWCIHFAAHNICNMLLTLRDFRYCHKCLLDQLLSQGYIALQLKKSFKKFYGRYQDIIEKYQRSVKEMVNDSFPR